MEKVADEDDRRFLLKTFNEKASNIQVDLSVSKRHLCDHGDIYVEDKKLIGLLV